MEKAIRDIRAGIQARRFVNEASVSQGIVQRLLYSLSWPVYDTEVVSPEYSLEGRRVDYALCHPPRKPLVLIEVKQVGAGSGADRQLFEYAFHAGVPMAVLTDGQEWSFFLPTEQGSYDERRVYKLDLLEREPEEARANLERYLDYGSVCSGRAIEAAREDYRNVARRRRAQDTLPDAWSRLVESEDELLLELLSDKVEDLCGVRPEPNSVGLFLRNNLLLRGERESSPPRMQPTNRNAQRGAKEAKNQEKSPSSLGYTIYGQSRQARSARDILIKVFAEFADRDPTFLERFAALPQGRKRRYLARSKEEVYPNRPDLFTYAYEVKPGWWIDTNVSKAHIAARLKTACELMNMKYGDELHVNLG